MLVHIVIPPTELETPSTLWVLSLPLSPCPRIPLHWGIEPSEDRGPLLPLMPNKAILCYIWGWRHGSLHVYSLVGGLVPGSSGGSGWLIFSSFSSFSNSCIGDPMLNPMVGCKHPPLYLSGPGRTSQEIAISSSCRQALLGIHSSVCAW